MALPSQVLHGMKTQTQSIEPCDSPEPDGEDRCKKCRRRLRLGGADDYCPQCIERSDRRRFWSSLTEPADWLDAAEDIGVLRGFCHHDNFPQFTDDGLANRIAANPLPKGGIIAVGPVGTHKSHLLAARTIDAARRGYSARFLNWSQFALEVRDTYKHSATETELDILSRYTSLDYLAMDDLGAGATKQDGRESEAARLLAYMLFDKRYAASRITDVSSNSTPDEIAQRFDARIGRRLKELCTVYPMLTADQQADRE